MSLDADWLLAERPRAALRALDGVLLEEMRPVDVRLRAVSRELLERRGKRLRPALVLVAGEFGRRRDRRRLLRGAAAVELLHVASLYHDDVMDQAARRRGAESVNHRWGNELGTVAGTYLFSRACALFAGLGTAADRLASEAALEICSGQLVEAENAFNLDLTQEQHIDIIRRKTGTLFELPCRLGALLTDATAAHAGALGRYGRHLGIAFQMADDALDLAGDPARLGKTTATDIREGVYSLAIVRALSAGDPGGALLRERLSRLSLAPEELVEIVGMVDGSGSISEVRALARSHAERARKALSTLPANRARDSLEALAVFAVSRSA